MAITPCLPVVKEQIRAEVYLGSQLISKTPYVKSFNVNKSRTQLSTTFNVTLEILGGTTFNTGQMLTIKAGLKGNLKSIFTGIVEHTSVRPVFGKPSYYSITLDGRGVLSKLENKTFSRRLKSDGQGMYCLITGGPSNRPAQGRTLDKVVNVGNHTLISNTPSLVRDGENSPLVVSNTTSGGRAAGGLLEEIAGKPGSGERGTGSSDGLGVHTHENLEQGGPAFAVFSAD